MRAGARLGPAQRMQPGATHHAHQLMPGGMKLHPVDAVAETVMRLQFRRETIGIRANACTCAEPTKPPALMQQNLRPAGPKSLHGCA